MRITRITDEAAYLPLSIDKASSFTQSWMYGTWHEAIQRPVIRFKLEDDKGVLGYGQALIILHGRIAYSYVPQGPITRRRLTSQESQELGEWIKTESKEKKLSFCRINPTHGSEYGSKVKRASWASYYGGLFQSTVDWEVPTDKDREVLLHNMHQKHRYSVRYAERYGVTTKFVKGSELNEYLETFLKMMDLTSARGKYRLHDIEYFKAMFDSAKKYPDLTIWMGIHQERIIAMHMVIYYGETAFYPYGCSTRGQNLNAPHLLHTMAMVEGAERGAKMYNLGAVDEIKEIPRPHWGGITEFKHRFGGQVKHWPRMVDIIHKPLPYYLWQAYKYALYGKTWLQFFKAKLKK